MPKDQSVVISDEEREREQTPDQNSQELDITCNEVVPESEQMADHSSNEDTMANTQAILDLPLQTPKKKKLVVSKGKGIGKSSAGRQRKLVQTMSFFVWLKNYWDVDSTMRLMGKFVTEIKKQSLLTQNSSLGKLVRPLNQIMKAFILHMDKLGHNLKRISWDNFESWALNQGLSTTYLNGQQMVWEENFSDLLFKIYGQVYMQEREKMEEQSSEEEEEFSSSRNTTTISTSSMTARTREEAADADSCAISQNASRSKPKTKTVSFKVKSSGNESTKASTSKLRISPRKSILASAKRPRKVQTDSEESEMEEEIIIPERKKVKVVSHHSESDPEEETTDNLNDMLDAAVRAQCLLRSTGSISQSIALKHQDTVITLKSRGERGVKVIKFEVYPYNDCLRKDKQEWWKYAEMRSLFLQYSDDSRVGELIQELTKEAFKQVQQTKKVEIKTADCKRT